MKKSFVFIAIVILIVGAVTLLFFSKNYNNINYNQDLLKLSENFENKKIVLCKEIPMKQIYIPNYYLLTFGRPFFHTDVDDYIKIDNVQKTKYGFNIILKSENQTLFMATRENGQIVNMKNFEKILFYKSKEILKIKEGMSLEEVKRLFPDSYLVTENSEIITSSNMKLENPFMEFICDDGSAFVIYFIEKNGIYYVESTLNCHAIESDVIKSWEKLCKETSKTRDGSLVS